MSDWEERDKSWKKFREEFEGGNRAKLAKKLGIGKFKPKPPKPGRIAS
jgi:hypothetical protein